MFGFKANVSGGVAFVDEDVVAFPVGHNIVVHNAKSNQQRFISANPKSESITAMAMSPNQRCVRLRCRRPACGARRAARGVRRTVPTLLAAMLSVPAPPDPVGERAPALHARLARSLTSRPHAAGSWRWRSARSRRR